MAFPRVLEGGLHGSAQEQFRGAGQGSFDVGMVYTYKVGPGKPSFKWSITGVPISFGL